MHADTSPDGAAVLTVTGEIDMHTAPQFRQALTQAAVSHPRLIVNVTALAYLDSAGIAALFAAARHTELELILGPGCLVTPVIEISKLEHVATISLRQ
ncbi:MAG: STAS domain-containing protein [Pseudonocardiaceae bacterium]